MHGWSGISPDAPVCHLLQYMPASLVIVAPEVRQDLPPCRPVQQRFAKPIFKKAGVVADHRGRHVCGGGGGGGKLPRSITRTKLDPALSRSIPLFY